MVNIAQPRKDYRWSHLIDGMAPSHDTLDLARMRSKLRFMWRPGGVNWNDI
jgi:hypothetical protein